MLNIDISLPRSSDLVPKPDMTKSLVWTYFGFVAGADGSPTLSFL